ncbi:hypothetical protein E2320_000431, partial [Naja naja]
MDVYNDLMSEIQGQDATKELEIGGSGP